MSAPPSVPARGAARRFVWRAQVVVALAAATLVLLLGLWWARSVVLLAFAGVLLGVFFRTAACWLAAHTPLAARWAVLVVFGGLLALLALALWLRAPAVAREVRELRSELPQALAELRARIAGTEVGRQLLDLLPGRGGPPPDVGALLSGATGVASTVVGALGSGLVVLVLGLAMAMQPAPYLHGVVLLVPRRHRARARAVLEEVRHTLARWLVGEALAMAFIFAITWTGLALLRVRLAFVLALVAGALEFVQYLGPIASGVPAVLVALVQGPQQALWVLLLYLGIQMIEGYVLQPLLTYRTVWLPPALTILMQVLLGLVGGLIGVALAGPLTAAAMVLVRRLYVEDVLGDRLDDEKGITAG